MILMVKTEIQTNSKTAQARGLGHIKANEA
jgi:hypothetical protein